MPNADRGPKVTIVGGGIAGLTAALRLAERGFSVEIFEKGPRLGGSLSAAKDLNGRYYDVYPHMFGQWYHNFWKVVEDIGLSREGAFERRDDCAALNANEFPNYRVLKNVGAFDTACKNVFSGILSPPEVFLVNYTILDLLSRWDSDTLENETLNDFIVNRPYATHTVAQFFNQYVENVWSIRSDLSSVLAFQRFAKHQFREPSPSAWVLKGNSWETLVKPLQQRLIELDCTIKEKTAVNGVTVRRGKVVEISYDEIEYNEDEDEEIFRRQHPEPHPVESLIIAASSPDALGELVFSSAKGGSAQSIVSLLPQLASVRRLGSEPIPVLYVTFNRSLPHIPPYYVALPGSKYALTFVKINELCGPQRTVLAIAASEFYEIPVQVSIAEARKRVQSALQAARKSEAAQDAKTHYRSEHAKDPALNKAARLILNEFQRYVPIDPLSDVDWSETFFHPNLDQKLFINEVGSQQWCTEVSYPEIDNLYFSGSSTKNPVTIATVESAVYSGLLAAQAVVQRGPGAAGRTPVPILPHDAYPTPLLIAGKIMLAPYAAASKLWIEADAVRKALMGEGGRGGVAAMARAASEFGRSAEAAIAEGWKAAESLYRRFLR